jgi:DNA polymerase-3 subunit epsilon
MLYSLIARADVIVGHNLDFDVNIIKLAKLRLGIAHQSDLFDGREHFCTQKNSAHIINLAPTEKMVKAGMHEVPKSPKLSEAFKFFFNEEIVGAHDALVDTEAALRIYLRIKHLRAPGTNNVI